MPNYSTIATDLTAQSVDILDAFGDAQTELQSQSAPETYFLEIGFIGGKIQRVWDGQQITSLSSAEQLRLYPQLGGLFNLAIRNLLYP